MNALNSLFVFIVVMLIMSYGMGMILGGPDKGGKIIQWELKQLSKMLRTLSPLSTRKLSRSRDSSWVSPFLLRGSHHASMKAGFNPSSVNAISTLSLPPRKLKLSSSSSRCMFCDDMESIIISDK
jgi:hypothetical protein